MVCVTAPAGSRPWFMVPDASEIHLGRQPCDDQRSAEGGPLAESIPVSRRGSPCSELAKEPAVTYATPRRSRMPATATATRRGSGSPSGAIGRPPPVRAARGLGAQAQRREPQQQLSLVRSGI